MPLYRKSASAFGSSLLYAADATEARDLLSPSLFSSVVPFIYPSSGSMADNGALTLTTALPTTYPHAFVRLPADAISAGSAAGWYYTVFSSTTAATVYNNAYTSGSPAVPASPTAFVTTGPGAYTQTTASDVIGPTYTMAGNTLTEGRRLYIQGNTRTPVNANGKTVRFRLESNSLGAFANVAAGGGWLEAYVRALPGAIQTFASSQSNAAAATLPGNLALNLTGNLTIDINFTLATATDYIVLGEFEATVT